jgi:hypothetical protein
MLASAKATASGPFEVCCWMDEDDPRRAEYPQDPIVRYGSGPREYVDGIPTMSYLWTRAWGLATGDIAMLAGDDSLFRTPGWDVAVEAEFAKVPDRIVMVYTDTGKVNNHNDHEPCNPFVSREWIDVVGYFTPPGYQGWFSDVWIWCLAAEISRAVFLPKVLIEHMRVQGSDQTYIDGEQAREAAGGWGALFDRFYSPPAVAERDKQAEQLRAAMTSGPIVPRRQPAWLRQSLRRPQRNPDTLVVVHCYAGDAEQVVNAMPLFTHHGCPVLVLSPEDAPVELDGIECRQAGKAAYIGQDSLDRQRAHLELLLEYPQRWFLLNDADSFCLSPKIPPYLYSAGDTVFSNEATDPRAPHSPYPSLALQPPYFVTRSAIEQMLAVADRITADEITPFIDWYMLALVSEAGLPHESFPDGTSLRGWRYGEVPEAAFGSVPTPTGQVSEGGVDGVPLMEAAVLAGAVMIHSVKHKDVLERMVAAHAAFAQSIHWQRPSRAPLRRPRPRPVRQPRPQRVAPPAEPLPPDQLSILVAFRDADGTRTHLWEFIRAKLERELPEAEIIVASDDGEDPFHKTLAINRAARDATGDVLAIWDADTWVLPEKVREAASFVVEHPERWSRPWNTKLKLNEEATAHVLQLGETWDGTIDHKPFGKPENRNPFWAAPPLLLHRSAFDAVGGMDERFRGWGGEDVGFAHALNRLVGKPRVFSSICIHLWHLRVERSGADLWPGQDDRTANAELLTRYVKANRPELMRELVSERTVSV